MGNCELAIRNYSRAIELSPLNINVLFNRSLCYGTMKKHDQALAAYKKAADLGLNGAKNKLINFK